MNKLVVKQITLILEKQDALAESVFGPQQLLPAETEKAFAILTEEMNRFAQDLALGKFYYAAA